MKVQCCLDTHDSFLQFRVNDSLTADAGMTPCGSCNCIISRLEVMHNNNIIGTIDKYDILSLIMVDSQVNAVDRAYNYILQKAA